MPHPTRHTATSDSNALPPSTPSYRRDVAEQTIALGANRDCGSFGWGVAGEILAWGGVWRGRCYIVGPRQVGSGRTDWFHLMQLGSDRLDHLAPY
jgi:hypothetical protein